jgi:hypothetical protein
MDELVRTLLVGTAGGVLISVGGLSAYYRIGDFTLYPWERSRRLWYALGALAVGTVVITLLIPVLGWLGLPLHVALLVGLGAIIVRHVRRGTRVVDESPAFEAERAKRRAFDQTWTGRVLLIGTFVAMLAWLVIGVPAVVG